MVLKILDELLSEILDLQLIEDGVIVRFLQFYHGHSILHLR